MTFLDYQLPPHLRFWFGRKLASGNLYIPQQIGGGLHAYVLSRKGAENLMKNVLPMRVPIDVLVAMRHENYKNLNCISLTKFWTRPRNIRDSDTSRIR